MKSSSLLLTITILAGAPLTGLPARTPAAPDMPAARSSDAVEPGPVIAALLKDLRAAEEKLVALATAIPAEDSDWRPAEGVRSVLEVLKHIAADNYFIPTAAGAAAPAETGIRADSYESVLAYENRDVGRDEAIQDLRASFQHLYRVMEGVDEARLTDPVDLFGQPSTGLELWVLTTTHIHEHLGQLIAYARSNDITPPWSR